jgi:hypothetical protein
MCTRPARDERGRLLPGSTANPRGRPPASRYARLFAAAAELGAVVVLLPQAQGVADEAAPTELPKVVA